MWRLTREGVGGLLRPEASTSWLGQVVNMPFKQARPPGGEKWGRIRLESGCQSHRVSLLSYTQAPLILPLPTPRPTRALSLSL